MSKSANQRLKLLYIADYLREKSHCDHPVSTSDIIAMLATKKIKAERKTIYSDIKVLRDYGFDIAYRKKKPDGFYMASGRLPISDLKLLVDAVRTSKFITESKSKELIDRLCDFTNIYEREELKRRVYVKDRDRVLNEFIFLNIDILHEAIRTEFRVSFIYSQWTLAKELRSDRENYRYLVSPYALLWDDETYQMIGYDHDAERIRTFRVDKILELRISDIPAGDKSIFSDINLASYSGQNFGILGGRSEKVTLSCKNEVVGDVIDRFGKEIIIIKETNSIFKVSVNVTVCPNFFGWLASFGGDMTITAPSNTVEEYKAYMKKVLGSVL